MGYRYFNRISFLFKKGNKGNGNAFTGKLKHCLYFFFTVIIK